MTGDRRPLLALGAPEVGERSKQSQRSLPRMSKPSAGRQGERLTPQLRALVEAFDAERAELTDGQVDEIDPELVLVFDLAGSIQDFRNAIQNIEGLEFLSEFIDEASEPDDDFHMTSRGSRMDRTVQHSLYLVMSNAAAVGQLLSLFQQWQQNPNIGFERGLGRFKTAFEQLRNIRRWGAEDRVRDTGLLEDWQEHLDVVGQSISSVSVEVELWYRRDAEQRVAAEAHLTELIQRSGGSVVNRAEIADISYHAILAEIPYQQVNTVLSDGGASIDLLNADEIMFVSPYRPMSIAGPDAPPVEVREITRVERVEGLPRVALLDGLPFANHDALAGRLSLDDPDGLEATYPVAVRNHGTAMASLILHGDLSAPGDPLDRPLYVRPLLQPHPFDKASETVVQGQLLTDLLHRAVRRIVEGEGGQAPAAPSVRIVNLSIGAESRALVRRMSPLGRLLDWLAVKYNLLFVVSAGNHRLPISIPADSAGSAEMAANEAARSVRGTSRLRGVLPPADAVNALTVGATHDDEAGAISVPSGIWDLVPLGAPALYGAFGPGFGRSIKPDVLHAGGRVLYEQPIVSSGATRVDLRSARTTLTGPGTLVAAPQRGGATDAVLFTAGTSNAAALVTREASAIFDALESGAESTDDFAFPDALYHPVLAKALLVHTSSWGDQEAHFREVLGLDPANARRELTTLLGYGSIRRERIANAATNRAVLISGGSIGRGQRHTYSIPLPESLRAKAEWHRFTITLAYLVPTISQLTRYRGAKVFFEKLDNNAAGGSRIEAEHNAVRRGSVQHEIVDGSSAMVFQDGDSIPIHVECMDDAQRLRADETIRYGLVVSVETEVATSATIHDEVQTALRARVAAEARARIQS